ncbi:MAG: hypothetical protein M3R08_12415 [Bacteroidota bacterium]|nr:hypothetical protein [Bacteroidota bacterium]
MEIEIYLWAVWTTEQEFVFDKCARNSGRVSSGLMLGSLLLIGFHGLKKIFNEIALKDTFNILITLFAVNHVIHLFYVFQNFNRHVVELSWIENLHGVITFASLLIIPVIVWSVSKLNTVLYVAILLHLFNATYFIMETFYSKIKPDKPAYHNQLGIAIMIVALIYVAYRVIQENRPKVIASSSA